MGSLSPSGLGSARASIVRLRFCSMPSTSTWNVTRGFDHKGHEILMRRKQWEKFGVGVMKNRLVVGGCGVVNPRRWWLWFGLVSLVVVGLLLVWVDWFVCVWSPFS